MNLLNFICCLLQENLLNSEQTRAVNYLTEMYLSNFLKTVKLETSPCDSKKKWFVKNMNFGKWFISNQVVFTLQFLGERLAFFCLPFPLKYQEPAVFSDGESEELELGDWQASEGWQALSFKEQVALLHTGQNFVQYLDAVCPKMSVAHLGIALGRGSLTGGNLEELFSNPEFSKVDLWHYPRCRSS